MKLKLRFTPVSIGELIALIVVIIIDIILIVTGINDMMLKLNYENALMYYGRGDFERSWEEVNGAMDADSEYPFPKELVAKIAIDKGDSDVAEKNYNDLLKINPNSENAYIGLVAVKLTRYDLDPKGYDKAKVIEDAKKLLEKAKSINRNCPEVYIGFGCLALRNGGNLDGKSALDWFKEAYSAKMIPTKEGLYDLYTGFGYWFFNYQYDPKLAYLYFKKAYQLFPKDERILLYLTFLLSDYISSKAMKRGLFENNEKKYLDFVKKAYEIYSAAKSAGTKKFPEGVKVESLRRAVYSLYNSLASRHYEYGEYGKANKEYRKAIEIYRECAFHSVVNLGYLNFKLSFVDSKKKSKYYWEAQRLWGGQLDNPLLEDFEKMTLMNNLLYIAKKIGQRGKLLKELKRVGGAANRVSSRHQDMKSVEKKVKELMAVIYKNLGTAYWGKKIKDSDKAVKYLNKSLLYNPNQPDVEKKINEIKGG